MAIKLYGKANWEFVLWFLIEPLITDKCRRFSRVQIIREDYEHIYPLLKWLGHKPRPEHPDKTIQKTLQNMRDKGWIDFYGQGQYGLTDSGYEVILGQKENLMKVREMVSKGALIEINTVLEEGGNP